MLLLFFCFVLFFETGFLCVALVSVCPGTLSVDQAGLELRNLPASASQVLGLKVCATTVWLSFFKSVQIHKVDMIIQCLKAFSK